MCRVEQRQRKGDERKKRGKRAYEREKEKAKEKKRERERRIISAASRVRGLSRKGCVASERGRS